MGEKINCETWKVITFSHFFSLVRKIIRKNFANWWCQHWVSFEDVIDGDDSNFHRKNSEFYFLNFIRNNKNGEIDKDSCILFRVVHCSQPINLHFKYVFNVGKLFVDWLFLNCFIQKLSNSKSLNLYLLCYKISLWQNINCIQKI